MKALRIHEFGTPGGVVLEDLGPAEAGPGEVVVRIEAASVDPLDLKILAGYMQQVFPVDFPYTLGTDFAGVVEAAGPQVAALRPGDRVVGRQAPSVGGAFAQATVSPAQSLCRIPDDMSFEQAAALPTAAGSAWLALFGAGQLARGQRVLIHAAAGGVGSFAVQLAKQAGAHVVATASAQNHPLVKALGADEVIDYRQDDFSARARNIDLVVDTIGGDTLERSWGVLRAGGRIASLADHTIRARGEADGSFVFFDHDPLVLAKIIQRFEARQLQVVLDTVHSLANARAALEQVAGGHAQGKVIVRNSFSFAVVNAHRMV
jgi:NADPH:quinone reductase-like Zn-dependent oxidoreductase